jgi:RNA polymerase sigma factor (sigma-70 family)
VTDEQLMLAYASGDLSAFQALYQRHKSHIFGFILKKLGNQQEAEEVFQIVFIKLHTSREKYYEEIPFLPWIFTIARNAVIDHVRKHQTYKKHVDSYIEDFEFSKDNEISNHSHFDVDPLSSLTGSQRDVLSLRFNEGLTFKEIAEQTQTSVVNSRQIVSRAIKKLRSLIKAKG